MVPMPSVYSINAGPFPSARTISKRTFEFYPLQSQKYILKDMKTASDQSCPFFSTLDVSLDNSAEISLIFEQTKIEYVKHSLSKSDCRFYAKVTFRMDAIKDEISQSKHFGCVLSHIDIPPSTNYHFRLQNDAFIINRSNMNENALKIYSHASCFFKEEKPNYIYQGAYPIWRLKSDQTYRLDSNCQAEIYLLELYPISQAKV